MPRRKRDSSTGPVACPSGSFTARSLTREPFQRLCRHLPLALVGQELRCLLEGQPPDFGNLVRVLGRDVTEPPGAIAEQEEADDLEDALAGPRVDVADVAQLLHGCRLHAGLLPDFAQGGQLGPLAR